MVRRSLLRDEDKAPERAEPQAVTPAPAGPPKAKARAGLVHIGAYYSPDDPLMNEFAKLGIDLRRTKQDMLMEAVADFVAKHKALKAFD